LFRFDPPLKPGIIEKYVQEHLSFVRQKWRKVGKVGGDATRPNGCPTNAWPKLVRYWKIPHAEHENEQMQKIHVDALPSCLIDSNVNLR
jgi:hypothetical protein